MTEAQILEQIEKNKCGVVEIRTLAGDRLAKIDCKEPSAAAEEFRDTLPNFKGDFKKLAIHGKANDGTNWSKGFIWTYDVPGKEVDKVAGVALNGNNGISVMEFVGFMQKSMEQSLASQKEILELKLAQQNQDPAKYAAIIREFMPMLGYSSAPAHAGMNGPAGNTLIFADVDTSKMSTEEIQKKMDEASIALSKKTSPAQMLRFMNALNANPQLTQQMDKINGLLEAIAKNPAYTDMAANFIK